MDDTVQFLANNPHILSEFDPAATNGSSNNAAQENLLEKLYLSEARVVSLLDKISHLERQKDELASVRRQPIRARDDELQRMTDQIKFLETQNQTALARAEALQKERDELKKKQAAAVEEVKKEGPPPKKLKAVAASAPTAVVEKKRESPPVAAAPVAVASAAPAAHAAPIAPLQEPQVDPHQLLVKKLYAGTDVFELLQQHSADDKASKEELLKITRDLALKMSTLFANTAATDGLAFTLALFLKVSGERVARNAMGVLFTLLASVPATRLRMHAGMVQVARTSVLPIVLNESEPWVSLCSVLIGHVAFQPSLSDALASQLLSVFALMAEGASSECLQVFLPLVATTSDFISSLLSHGLSLKVQTVNFLTCLMKSSHVFALCRQSRGEHSPSLLSSIALLMSVDVDANELAVLALRQSVVRLFSVVVSYPDWESSGVEGVVIGGADLRQRVVMLLFELIQSLRANSSDQFAIAVLETFNLLTECTKQDNILNSLKACRQLFISSLVALAAVPVMHSTLSSVQPLASSLLREVQVDSFSQMASSSGKSQSQA